MLKKKQDGDSKPIEQQIAELQRKFRVLENDKRSFSEDSQGTIRKQRATVEKLTRENHKMKNELSGLRTSAGSTGPEQRRMQDELSKTSDERASLQYKLEAELELAQKYNEKVDMMQKRVFALRQEMGQKGGVNAAAENNKMISRQIKILENRLDKGLQKFNEGVAANRNLRDQIDTLRGERVVFDNIYKKLEGELQQKKKEMAAIIEQANFAYDARDNAQTQMAQLKQQADKEHGDFQKEWLELGRLIENDKKMKEFMRQKERHRQEEEKRGELSADQEDRLKKKVTKSAWGIAKDKATMSLNMEKVQTYEQLFAKIQAATGISDIDDLVEKFIDAEDENFSLFNYNNELSSDIEKLEQQIADYRQEYEQLSGMSNCKEDVDKAQLLETLEQRWDSIDKKKDLYDLKHQQSLKTLTSVRAGIQSIFHRLGCSGVEGMGQDVTEDNMTSCLGAIEQRTNEILALWDQMKTGGGEDEDRGERPRPAKGATAAAQFKLPSTVEDYSDDEEEDEEDDQRPFTRDELKQKTMRGLGKKHGKSRRK